jgi:hypothetical protein
MHLAKIKYRFRAKPWKYQGSAGWVFVSLPPELSAEIRELLGREEQGWGRLSLTARLGSSEWKTAIWFDTKENSYLLPLKAAVRKKEDIRIGTPVEIELMI